MCRQALLIARAVSCSDFRVDAVEPRKCTVSAGSYGAEASTAPAALMDCWTFMCTVCNVCRSDGGDQLAKVNRVEQTNKSVRLTERKSFVRSLSRPFFMRRVSQRLCETCGQQGQVMGRTECYMMRLSDPLVLCTSSVSATGEGVWECAGDARALESSKSLLYLPLPFTLMSKCFFTSFWVMEMFDLCHV